MTLRFAIVYSILCSVSSLYAQPQQQWVRNYNSTPGANEYTIDMKIDADDNVYICGNIEHTNGNKDIVLLKYDNRGNLLWQQIYDTSLYDVCWQMEIDADLNIYIRGTIGLYQTLTVLKYNSKGELIWEFISIDPGPDEAFTSLTLDPNQNVYITGTTNIVNGDIITLKIDQNGKFEWDKTFIGQYEGHEGGLDIKQTGDTILVLGTSISDTLKGTNRDITLLKYDLDGNPLDTFYIDGGRPQEGGYILKINEHNNYIIAGIQIFPPPFGEDLFIMSVKSTGELNWVSTFRSSVTNNENERLKDVKIDGKYIYLLCSGTYVVGRSAYTLIKYNNDGDSLWVRKYNSVNNSINEPSSLVVDSSGNSIITGYSDFNQLHNRIATVKYSSEGVKLWDVNYFNLFTNNVGKRIVLNSKANIIVSGESTSFNNGWDIVLIKYNNPTSIILDPTSVALGFRLQQNYPNPFNSNTLISFEIIAKGSYTMEITDILGRRIETIFSKKLDKGKYKINYGASDLSTGIYYCRLISEKATLIKKLTLIR